MKCAMCGNEILDASDTVTLSYKLYLPRNDTETDEVNTCGRCFIATKTLEALQAMLNKLGELI